MTVILFPRAPRRRRVAALNSRRVARLAVVVVALLIMGTFPAYAYLDPGTGSVLLQLLLGGVAGIAMAAKLYWARIKGLFGRRTKPGPARIEPE